MDTALQTIQCLDGKTLFAILIMIIAACLAMGKLMMIGFNRMEIRMDKRFALIDQRFDRMDQRMDKMQETITDIDRRICRLEGAFQSKDCCLLKSDSQLKKAE